MYGNPTSKSAEFLIQNNVFVDRFKKEFTEKF